MLSRNLAIAILLTLSVGCGDDDDGATPDAAAGAADARVGPDGATFGWRSLANVGLGAVQETGVAALDGKIYVVGGFDGNLAILDAVQVYDPTLDQWTTAAPLPRAVHHANLVATGGKLYLVGAAIDFTFTPIPDVYEYDPVGDQWTQKTSMSAALARGSSAVGVINGKIYLAGGLGNGSVATVSSYDPSLDQWDETLAPLPVGRDHLAGAAVGGKLYAIGGRSDGIEAVVDRVDIYDPVINQWSSGAAMITARGGTAAAVVGNEILVVGGEGNTAIASGVFPQLEAYDTVGDSWRALEPMLSPRHGMGAAAIGNAIYVPGGADTQIFGAVSTNEAYLVQ